jgi:hypothetical protein
LPGRKANCPQIAQIAQIKRQEEVFLIFNLGHLCNLWMNILRTTQGLVWWFRKFAISRNRAAIARSAGDEAIHLLPPIFCRMDCRAPLGPAMTILLTAAGQ